MNYFNRMCMQTNYIPLTTCWDTFSYIETYGPEVIEEQYKIFFKDWADDVKLFAELVMILNWKCWYWYKNNNDEYSLIYEKLYIEANDWGWDHFKGDDLTYFWQVLD